MKSLLLLPLLAAAAAAAEPSADERIKALEARLEKLESAPAKTSLSAFNPAMGAAIDFAYQQENDKASFNFRAAELNVEAPVDPYLKAWTILSGNNREFGVEEAALQTTALPWNLTLTGGRLFASFGRLAGWHDHELPVTERPRSIDVYVGGESQADGIEASWLAPLPFYLNLTAGMYNKLGADNARADNAGQRPLSSFTYLGRAATYADLGDDHSVELGTSLAWTPRRDVTDTSVAGTDYNADGTPDAPNTSAGIVTRKNTWRTLAGVDLTYRWHPTSEGLYKGATWGTEVFQNVERRFDATTNLPTDRVRAWSGYSYLEMKAGRRWRPGVLVDLTEDLDSSKSITRTFTAYLSCDVTEFQRLRASVSRRDSNVPTSRGSDLVALQWTGVFGRHVHGFRGH